MVLSDGAERAYSFRHSEYPLPKIEIVRRLIQQNSAALAVPCSPPAARIVVSLGAVPVGDYPDKAFGLPESAALNYLMSFSVNGICALIEHYREFNAGAVCRFVHFTNASGGHARRLLYHNMDTALKAFDCVNGVPIMRHGNERSIDKTAVQKLLGGVEAGSAGLNFPRVIQLFLVYVGYCRYLDFGTFSIANVSQMSAAHIANTDYSKSYLVHYIPSNNSLSAFTAAVNAVRESG